MHNGTHVDTAYHSFKKILTALKAACPLKKSRRKRTRDYRSRTNEEVIILKNKNLEALQNEILKGSTVKTKTETAVRKKECDLRLKQLRKQQLQTI